MPKGAPGNDWKRLATLCLLAAVVLAIALAFQSSTLLAQTVPQTVPESTADVTSVEEPNPTFAAYAEAMKLSYEEAEQRLLLQFPLGELGAKIGEAEPTYAGSWIQHEPEFGLVVALTDPNGQAIVEKYLQDVEWADLVHVVQRPHTLAELDGMLQQVQATLKGVEGISDLLYATALNIQAGKVQLFSPVPDALQERLVQEQLLRGTTVTVDKIEFVLQEYKMVPAQWKYPYLPGGTPIRTCTAGFVVKRYNDNRRFISTAGHCDNLQNALYAYPDMTGIYLGPMVMENNPNVIPPIGPRGYAADFQTHNVLVRDFDLTNQVRTGTATTSRVIAYQYKASTLNKWVCKYGRMTGHTCGQVWNIDWSP